MLSTADRIRDGDATSWCTEWTATADRVAAIADGCAASGHAVSARSAYLRASAYYALALSAVGGTPDPAALLLPTFPAHRRGLPPPPPLPGPPPPDARHPPPGTPPPRAVFHPPPGGGGRPPLVLQK